MSLKFYLDKFFVLVKIFSSYQQKKDIDDIKSKIK